MKVGAVAARDGIVLSTGRNGFPAGVPDDIHLYTNKELKLLLTTHAEANCIAAAARAGHSLDMADLFVTFAPCNDCAELIIGAGFDRVFTTNIPTEGQWLYRYNLAKAMFNKVGIVVFENGVYNVNTLDVTYCVRELANFLKGNDYA